MARGHQKIQSQKKNQERQAKLKKNTDNRAAAKKALVFTCPICRVSAYWCYILEESLLVLILYVLPLKVSEVTCSCPSFLTPH